VVSLTKEQILEPLSKPGVGSKGVMHAQASKGFEMIREGRYII
jgi:hypothetical protein